LLFARYRRPLAVFAGLVCLWLTIRSAAPSPPPTVAVSVAAHDLAAGHTLKPGDLRTADWPANKAPEGRLDSAIGLALATPLRAGELLTDTRVLGSGLLAGQPPGTVAVPVRLGEPSASMLVRAGDRVDVLVSASASSWSSGPDLADGTDLPGTDLADSTGYPDSTGHPDSTVASGSGVGDASGATRLATNALVLAVPGGGAGWMTGSGSDGDNGSAGSDGSGDSGSGLAGLAGGGSDSVDGSGASAGVIVLAVSSFEAARLAAAQTGSFIGIAVLQQS
jgi:SAF domain